jgi:hypothetical protein
MTESELDRIYGDLCREITDVGESDALVFLARFALLAIEKIDDAEATSTLLSAARAAGAADRRNI